LDGRRDAEPPMLGHAHILEVLWLERIRDHRVCGVSAGWISIQRERPRLNRNVVLRLIAPRRKEGSDRINTTREMERLERNDHRHGKTSIQLGSGRTTNNRVVM